MGAARLAPMTSAAGLATGSLVVALAVLGLKLLAWRLTGSLALWSDALESVVNVAASLAALLAVRLADKPADRQHPYGHHKAEYFSAVLEGVLVIIAALSIALAAWEAIAAPRMPALAPAGIAVNALASVINAAWGWLLVRRGRVLGSPALVADGRHLFTDVVSSAGVLAGLGLALATGWAVLDPLLALAVAANILWSGWLLVRASVGGLMDEAVDPATMARLREVIAAAAGGAIEAHDLRTRNAGRMTFIDFHLVVPGEQTVSEAHRICDRIEAAIRAEIGEVVISIHVEPDWKAKRQGAVLP
jgi:cation diffusion facilitator family transporter